MLGILTMTIAHDQYLKYITPEVMDDTLAFHAKGNYTIHRSTQHISTLHNIPSKTLEKLTGNELPLNVFTNSSNHTALSLSTLPANHCLRRNDSCPHFPGHTIAFDTVRSLLAPLLKKNELSYKRGYPSGGALYPVEVFCINLHNKIDHWPTQSNALHLLPSSQTFEAHTPTIDIDKLSRAIVPDCSNIGSPALAIAYFIYLPKALFKYRYRGYRLALMETGSMYMLTDLRCKELGLEGRPWSGFTDHEVTNGLNLNPALFLPTCIQLVG